MLLDVKRRERLSWSASALLSATSLDVEHRGCLPWFAIALAPSALPRHPTLSVEDAPGLPQPSSLPRRASRTPPLVCHRPRTLRFATSPDVERRGRPRSATALLSATSLDVEHRGHLPQSANAMPLHPPLSHVTQRRASRMPPVCHCPPLCHFTSHLASRTPPPACHCPIKSPATPHNM